MILVALESPCVGDFERNRRYALWCAYHCYTKGEAAAWKAEHPDG